MEAEYEIVREDEGGEPREEQAQVDDRAPAKDTSNDLECHDVLFCPILYS
jgi:hypothetical protein